MTVNYSQDLGWRNQIQTNNAMNWKQAISAFILPLILQVLGLLVVSVFDPCNNNPGCMAGSMTAYAAILLIPASAIFLLILVMGQKMMGVAWRKALVVNSLLAVLPMLLAIGFVVTH